MILFLKFNKMKTRLLLLLFFFPLSYIHSQDPLAVKEYRLKNGLTVYLNEDHTLPNVFGAVVVKGGSKRDPADATGIAHYFEHIMFKGTDELGTVGYAAEKVYLDSIRSEYDSLGTTADAALREKIQLKINDLSIKAADYAIPNELNNILSGIGSTAINAYTTEENIVYFNIFPGEQIEKWLEIYSHRFKHPVFRLFQSELETVYEEKNMSMDNAFMALVENFNKSFYKVHPYGQHPVLGTVDDLKNPSISKMMDYFNTYYVANNMALVLCGDFKSYRVIPLIEEKFGTWRTGDVPVFPEYKEEPFTGREVVEKRLTPIKLGLIGYRTVPAGHPDEIALEVADQILSNQSQTGLLDKLYTDNKIMGAAIFPYVHTDIGAAVILIAPKILGQSLEKAESLVMNEVKKLEKGGFDDDLLMAVKLNLIINHEQMLESNMNRSFDIIECFMEGKIWEDFLSYPDKVRKITKEDVMRVADKYYGDDYLCFYSKMGFPKKEKLNKPSYKEVAPKNTEARSVFAHKIDSMPAIKVEPRFIEFNPDATAAPDVTVLDLSDNIHYYYTPDPVNDLFRLDIQYGVGTRKVPVLNQAADYLSNLGTTGHTFSEFNKMLQNMGSNYFIYASPDYFTVSVTGIDDNFERTMRLMNELLTDMKADDAQLPKLVEDAKANRKVETKEVTMESEGLYQFALLKEGSPYLKRLSLQEVKRLKSDSLLAVIKKTLHFETDIFYSGRIDCDTVREILMKSITWPQHPVKSESPIVPEMISYDRNVIYFMDDKRAVQSQVRIFVEGANTGESTRTYAQPFNEYFGSGMSSLVFQTIREFHSYAYSAYAYYMPPARDGFKGVLTGGMSTQADKTCDALASLRELVVNMPQKPERTGNIRELILQSVNSGRPTFRGLAPKVSSWIKMGYHDDPQKHRMDHYSNLTFDDILAFYRDNIADRPVIITIVGDKKRIDMKRLSTMGTLLEVKEKDIFSE
jgi:zinc protease